MCSVYKRQNVKRKLFLRSSTVNNALQLSLDCDDDDDDE